MKFAVSKQDLLNALMTVNRSAKSNAEILNTIYFKAEGNVLALVTTDIELTLISRVPSAEIVEEGGICLPMRQIVSLIKELPEEKIELTTTGDVSAVINYNNSQVKLKGYLADQFPALPDLSDVRAGFSLSQGLLKEIIKQTAYAASTDRTRLILTGVNFDLAGSQVTFVATDMHRLAVRKVDLDVQQVLSVVVPERTLNELARILQNEIETVKVAITGNMISFGTKTAAVISRLIAGQYPNYRTVIPNTFKSEVSFNRSDFADALARALILVEDIPVASFSFGEVSRLRLNTSSGGINEILKVAYKGEPMEVYFNLQFLYEAVRAMPADEITFCL
ncbi:MAG: DNA polymerase III subunit beta, partial [Desulfotomaculales bacterium]